MQSRYENPVAFIKPDIKEICKKVENVTLLLKCFCLGNYSYFYLKNVIHVSI